jgi:hypothetical protein
MEQEYKNVSSVDENLKTAPNGICYVNSCSRGETKEIHK